MGNKGISFFLDKETWPHIISIHDCFNFKSFNPKGKKNHIRGCPYFALTSFCIIFYFFVVLLFS